MSLKLNGATSGSIELDVPAAIGSDLNITIPATAGEVAVKGTDGSVDLGDVNIDSSGRLLVGTSTYYSTRPNAAIYLDSTLTTVGFGNISLGFNGTSASNQNVLTFYRTRGTSAGSVDIVQSGDSLGSIDFNGADGVDALTSAAAIKAEVDGTPGANDMPGRLVFSTTADGGSSPTERMRIRSDGTVATANGFGIGNVVNAIANSFYIASSAIASGAGNSTLKYNTGTGLVSYDTSSRLVKENIEDCPYGIEELKQLQPRKYFRIDDQRGEIGFVADEMIQVMPEFVPIGAKSVITRNDEDTEQIPLGVNYEKLTAVLTAALQEAITKIETLEAKVAALEANP